MDFLQQIFSGDNSALQLVVITLLLVITLILIVWIVRKVAGGSSPKNKRGRIRRISVTDSAMVDDKRYLVLVRRDNVEHLVLIGGPTDVVVEQGIVRVEADDMASETHIPAPTPVEEAPKMEPVSPVVPAAAATAVVAAASTMPEPEAPIEEPDIAQEPAQSVEESTADALDEALQDLSLDGLDLTEEPTVTSDADSSVDLDLTEISLEPEVSEPSAEPVEISAPAAEINHTDAAPTEVSEPEVNLEDALTNSLDEALATEDFTVLTQGDTRDATAVTEAPTIETPTERSNADDEMERLLAELAGETKEKA